MSHLPHPPNPTGPVHMDGSSGTSLSKPRSLHVVHLIKGLGPGGAERLIVNQLKSAEGNVTYSVVRLLREKFQLVEAIEETGARTSVVGGGRLWPLRLRRAIQAGQPDIVHVHSPVLAGVVRTLRGAGLIDAKVVTTEHNRWPRHHRLTRLLNRRSARFDDARIAVSSDVRESMDAHLRPTTEVIDHGVPLHEIRTLGAGSDEVRARLIGDAATTHTIIGIVANFRPEKGYDVFFDAARRVCELRENVRFVVIGQGPGETDFRALVDAAGLESRIDVLGYRDDATAVMSAFDIFTLTSRHEGKPVSLMEALALGIPSVCTRSGGIPEMIVHEESGLLVDVGDAAGIAAAWLRLIDDKTLRASVAQAAAERASSFDAIVATRSIESLYRRVVG